MLFLSVINKRPLDKNGLKFTSNFVDKFMPDLDPSLKEKEESTCIACFAQLNENVQEKDEGAGFVIDFLLPESKRIVVYMFTGG
jgi:hypothetical protein